MENDHPNDEQQQQEEGELDRQQLILRRLWFLTVFFFGIVLPVLAMAQCSGWNEGTMKVKSCSVIDTSWSRFYAEQCYGWTLMFAFSGGIALVIYLLFLWGLCKLVPFVVSLVHREMSWCTTRQSSWNTREPRLLDHEANGELV